MTEMKGLNFSGLVASEAQASHSLEEMSETDEMIHREISIATAYGCITPMKTPTACMLLRIQFTWLLLNPARRLRLWRPHDLLRIHHSATGQRVQQPTAGHDAQEQAAKPRQQLLNLQLQLQASMIAADISARGYGATADLIDSRAYQYRYYDAGPLPS